MDFYCSELQIFNLIKYIFKHFGDINIIQHLRFYLLEIILIIIV